MPDDWRILNDLAALYAVQPLERVRQEAEQCWIQSLALGPFFTALPARTTNSFRAETRQPKIWSALGCLRMHNADALGASQALSVPTLIPAPCH